MAMALIACLAALVETAVLAGRARVVLARRRIARLVLLLATGLQVLRILCLAAGLFRHAASVVRLSAMEASHVPARRSIDLPRLIPELQPAPLSHPPAKLEAVNHRRARPVTPAAATRPAAA